MKILYLAVPILLAMGQAAAPPSDVGTPADANQRMELAAKVNGLQGLDIPIHIKATYEVFGSDGKSTDKGTYEEWRLDKTHYRIALHSPSISVERFGSDQGVFKMGEQEWPLKPLSAIQPAIARPVVWQSPAKNFHPENYERKFGDDTLPCTGLIFDGSAVPPIDAQGYCFLATNAILVYATNRNRLVQTVFQQIALLRGHYFARDMHWLLEGKPWLNLHIDVLEDLGATGKQALTVPAGAVPVAGPGHPVGEGDATAGRVAKKVPPLYPVPAKAQRIEGTVLLNGVIDREGHLQRLQALAGPPILQKAAIDAAKQWVYTPYLLDGNPVEVETEIYVVFALSRR